MSQEAATISVTLGDGLIRKSLARQVAEALQERIIDGRLPPGTRLAAEAIAAAFSVSRSPVREAIADLENRGLAEQLSSRERRVTVPSEKFIRDTFELLSVLESARLYAASLVAGGGTIARARQILSRMDALALSGDHVQLGRASREFHRLLQQDCANAQLNRAADEWYTYIAWFRNLYFDSHTHASAATAAEHRRIVDCFAARDRAGLQEAVRVHVEAHRDSVLLSWRASASARLVGTNQSLELTLDGAAR